MSILSPDKHLFYHKIYSLSNKSLIPLMITSFTLNKMKINKNCENIIHYFNIINFGYHSYYSTSSIITDYIKPKNIKFFARLSNFNLHSIASLGLLYYINKT